MLKMSEMFTPCGKEYGSFICRDLSLDLEKYLTDVVSYNFIDRIRYSQIYLDLKNSFMEMNMKIELSFDKRIMY